MKLYMGDESDVRDYARQLEPRCPYCGALNLVEDLEQDHGWQYGDMMCDVCGETFILTWGTVYSTAKRQKWPPTRSRGSVITDWYTGNKSVVRAHWYLWGSRWSMQIHRSDFDHRFGMNEEDQYWWGFDEEPYYM
jgi:hypothetical protein